VPGGAKNSNLFDELSKVNFSIGIAVVAFALLTKGDNHCVSDHTGDIL